MSVGNSDSCSRSFPLGYRFSVPVQSYEFKPSYVRQEYEDALDLIHQQLCKMDTLAVDPKSELHSFQYLSQVVHNTAATTEDRTAVGAIKSEEGQGIVLVTRIGALKFEKSNGSHWILDPGANLAVRFAEYDFQPTSYHPLYLFSRMNNHILRGSYNLRPEKDSCFFEHDIQIRAAMMERVDLVVYGVESNPPKDAFREVTEEAYFIINASTSYGDMLNHARQHDYVKKWMVSPTALIEMAAIHLKNSVKEMLDGICRGEYTNDGESAELLQLVELYRQLLAGNPPHMVVTTSSYDSIKLKMVEANRLMSKFQKKK